MLLYHAGEVSQAEWIKPLKVSADFRRLRQWLDHRWARPFVARLPK
jgi:hypothetical protein